MPEPVNLAEFKPNSAGELFDGVLSHVLPVLADNWERAQEDVEPALKSIAISAFNTQRRLKIGEINQDKADALLHIQELALSNTLLYAEFLTYVLRQEIVDAVFKVITAAIKNWTGVDLNF